MTLSRSLGHRSRAVTLGGLLSIVAFLLFCPLFDLSALSEETDCLSCHEDLKKEKVVHAAIDMGCPTCHSGIDAKDVPHKKTNKIEKGLTAPQPDLCYNCHDKAPFTKQNVHAAVSMGCTGCHNPHSSKNAKLMKSALPNLCFDCHEKAEFSKKNVHMPVAGGDCLSCHSAHSSEYMALLKKEPMNVCVECHEDVKKKPHAIVGFSSVGHPLGEPRKGKVPDDPARPGKKFYCGSCHTPHSSDAAKLYRFKAASSFELCTHCHKM